MKKLIVGMLVFFAAPAFAEPYRLIQARSGHQARGGNLELGLKYQGLLAGDDYPDAFHQLAFSLRLGVIDRLEIETEASLIIWHDDVGDPSHVQVDPGDIKLAGQVQLVREHPHILATYLGFTFPTAPSNAALPPQFADGTFDIEALMIYELDASRFFRLIFNVGWEFLGKYHDGPNKNVDVPDAFRYDAAIALHPTSRLQLSLELNGRYHTERAITPVWVNNQSILELTPGLRFEITPRWVFEGGAGIALNDDTRAMYKVRVVAGVTYEFPVY